MIVAKRYFFAKISLLLSFFTIFCYSNAWAWNHEVAINYGSSRESQQDYSNSVYGVSGKFLKFKLDNTLVFTIDGTFGQWTAHTDEYRHLTNFAISPALRAYFANYTRHNIRPYLGISSGPSYYTQEQLGEQLQNTHFGLQSTLETGIEIGNQQHSLDLNLHLLHICNGGLALPNQGYDVTTVFSIGYQF